MTGEKRHTLKYGRRVIQYAAVILPSLALGVLAMLGEISPVLMAAGVLSLALIPAFWMVGFRRKRNIQMLSLAIYYAVITFFAMSGAYPMPLMGFGLSPIAGYWLACVFVTESVKISA